MAEPRALKFYQADVFTSRPFGGNPVAVFPDAKNLTDEFGITSYAPGGVPQLGIWGTGLVSMIRPRTIGVRFAADF